MSTCANKKYKRALDLRRVALIKSASNCSVIMNANKVINRFGLSLSESIEYMRAFNVELIGYVRDIKHFMCKISKY